MLLRCSGSHFRPLEDHYCSVLRNEGPYAGPSAVRDWLAELQPGQQLRYSFVHCADFERAGARRDWLLASLGACHPPFLPPPLVKLGVWCVLRQCCMAGILYHPSPLLDAQVMNACDQYFVDVCTLHCRSLCCERFYLTLPDCLLVVATLLMVETTTIAICCLYDATIRFAIILLKRMLPPAPSVTWSANL